MSKLERQVAVKFRRKHAIKGNSVMVVKIPSELDIYMEHEYNAIQEAITQGDYFYVQDGDETGVLIQLPEIHDYTWLPASCVERVS
ncbi:hypothetical protein D3C75_615070 [compost metagenome]